MKDETQNTKHETLLIKIMKKSKYICKYFCFEEVLRDVCKRTMNIKAAFKK